MLIYVCDDCVSFFCDAAKCQIWSCQVPNMELPSAKYGAAKCQIWSCLFSKTSGTPGNAQCTCHMLLLDMIYESVAKRKACLRQKKHRAIDQSLFPVQLLHF